MIHRGWEAVAEIGEHHKARHRSLNAGQDKVDKVHESFAMTLRTCKQLPTGVRARRVSGKLPAWGRLIELCTSEHSNLGRVAKEYRGVYVDRVTKEMDILNDKFFRTLLVQTERRPGISLHASLPCTVWSQWQSMAVHKLGPGMRGILSYGVSVQGIWFVVSSR